MPTLFTALKSDFGPLDLLPATHLNEQSEWTETACFGLSLVTHDDSPALSLDESEDRPGILLIYGALTTNREVVVRPDAGARWWLANATSGGFSLTFRTSTGVGVTLPAGWGCWARSDGDDILAMTIPQALSGGQALLPAGALLAEGADIAAGTAAGSRIGTSALQKLGFYGAAPVVRPAALTAPNAASIDSAWDAIEQGVVENLRTRLNELEVRLQSLGLIG